MTEEHTITPSPELVQRLRSEAPHGIRDAGVTRELHLITAAYRAGANQALERAMAAVLEPLGADHSTESELLLRRAWDRVRLS
jgi:hypothetical protein